MRHFIERILLAILLCIGFTSVGVAQQSTVTAKTVNATQHLTVSGNQVDSISKDVNMVNNSDRNLPTQKAVKGYVTSQITGTVTTFVWYTNIGARLIFGHGDTLYTATIVGTGGLQATKTTDSSQVIISQGAGGRSGTTTLVAGVKAITISGITTSSLPFLQLTTPSGITTTVHYKAVCTTNTLTITAITSSGSTNTSDISGIVYNVIN